MSEYSDEEIEATLQVGAFKKGQSNRIVRWVALVTLSAILCIASFAMPHTFFVIDFTVGLLAMLIGLIYLYGETPQGK